MYIARRTVFFPWSDMSITNCYESTPKVMGAYLDEENLYQAVREQMEGYVKSPSNSDRTYALMPSSHTIPTIRIIFNASHPVALSADKCKEGCKCLILTNIRNTSDQYFKFWKIRNIAAQSGVGVTIFTPSMKSSPATFEEIQAESALFLNKISLYSEKQDSSVDNKKTSS
jgi:hypothetical protein